MGGHEDRNNVRACGVEFKLSQRRGWPHADFLALGAMRSGSLSLSATGRSHIDVSSAFNETNTFKVRIRTSRCRRCQSRLCGPCASCFGQARPHALLGRAFRLEPVIKAQVGQRASQSSECAARQLQPAPSCRPARQPSRPRSACRVCSKSCGETDQPLADAKSAAKSYRPSSRGRCRCRDRP
jgi:hypothetical protein